MKPANEAPGARHPEPAPLACIEVRRTRHWIAALRRLSIRVDGHEAGAVAFGRTTQLCVPPGRHRVQVRIDWGRSPEVEVDLEAGERVILEAGRPQRGLRVLTAWLEALVRPGNVLRLRRLDG
ncbi:MAG: hypothetical protein ACQGVK_19925 [Myxococcota bacterium]